MGLLGGLTSSFINPMNLTMLAAGPAGWATLAAKTLMSAVGQQIIQQVGQQLGVPQSTIDLAQGAFAGSMGDASGATQNLGDAVQNFGELLNASPLQIGDAQRELEDVIGKMASSLAEGKDAKDAKSSGGAKSWIMALAEALGKKLDKKADEVADLANDINDKKPSTTTKFGAASQEFSVLMNAANTAIKTLGEAVSSMSRKQ